MRRFLILALICTFLAICASYVQSIMTPTFSEVELSNTIETDSRGWIIIFGILSSLAALGYGFLAVLAFFFQNRPTAGRFEKGLWIALIFIGIIFCSMLLLVG